MGKLTSGLVGVEDKPVLERFIQIAQNETIVRRQDFIEMISQMGQSGIVGRDVVWNYVKSNWDVIVERFGIGNRHLGRVVSRVSRTFNTQAQLDDLRAFFLKYPDGGAGARNRLVAEETLIQNIEWASDPQRVEKISEWLKDNLKDMQ